MIDYISTLLTRIIVQVSSRPKSVVLRSRFDRRRHFFTGRTQEALRTSYYQLGQGCWSTPKYSNKLLRMTAAAYLHILAKQLLLKYLQMKFSTAMYCDFTITLIVTIPRSRRTYTSLVINNPEDEYVCILCTSRIVGHNMCCNPNTHHEGLSVREIANEITMPRLTYKETTIFCIIPSLHSSVGLNNGCNYWTNNLIMIIRFSVHRQFTWNRYLGTR